VLTDVNEAAAELAQMPVFKKKRHFRVNKQVDEGEKLVKCVATTKERNYADWFALPKPKLVYDGT
jgi:hypothetical protein